MSFMPGIVKNALKSPLELFAANLGPHRRANPNTMWAIMYHRILPPSDSRYLTEEPGMVVEPETFRQHLQQLKQLFTILPLTEWVERQQSGRVLPANCCTITFDDGWADNYEYAFPIIEQEQVPVTLFAVSDMLGGQQQFWPNRVAELLTHASIDQLQELEWLARLLPDTQGKAFTTEHSASVIKQLKVFTDQQIHQWLSGTESLITHLTPSSPLVSWEQLKTMSSSNLVDIGSHTCNHYRLQDTLDPAVTAQEVLQSQQRLQDELGKPVDLFCYPNGDVSPAALALVKKHYKAAVTTERGINRPSATTDLHQLKRIGVHQHISRSSTQFQARLANWL